MQGYRPPRACKSSIADCSARGRPRAAALIDEQYQDYIDGTEDYLNCLNDKAVRAWAAYYSVFERSIQYFGIEAEVEFDTAD